MRIWDGHVTLGTGSEVSLGIEDLLRSMDRGAVERALIAPPDSFVAVRNADGNRAMAAAVRAHADRLGAYAVASPWLESEAIQILEAAAVAGARALHLDPATQGFDLLGSLVDPLIEFAVSANWPVYVRTGTPIRGLPLQLAEVACRHPTARFILGRSGATDFWQDVVPTLERAPNIWADTAYSCSLEALLDHPAIGAARIVFTSDAPYANPDRELAKTLALVPDQALGAIMADNLAALLGETLQ